VNTKILMRASSLVLGLAGLALLFAPREIVAALGSPGTAAVSVLAQLIGTMYVALALLNWTAKDSPIGGIYARPISLANFAHFFVGTLVLARAQLAQGRQLTAVGVLIGYAVFAILFGWLVFGATGLRKSQPTSDTISPE
jgi:hypothetical protein